MRKLASKRICVRARACGIFWSLLCLAKFQSAQADREKLVFTRKLGFRAWVDKKLEEVNVNV